MKQLAQVPIGPTFGSPFGQQGAGIGTLISLFLRGAFVVSGLIILFFIIGGGLKIIQGAGNDDPKSIAQGREAITGAIVGLVIVFVAYWIIRLIEVVTGGATFITNPGF